MKNPKSNIGWVESVEQKVTQRSGIPKIVFTDEDSNKIFELLWFDRYWNFVSDALDSSAIERL